MTFLAGCRLYPKAIAWSILLSSTLIMEGYDLALVSNFFTLPSFRRSFGHLTIHGDYQIPPEWQSGLTNSSKATEIIGLLINGLLSDRIGYRRTLAASLIWLAVSVFLSFFAANIQMLLAAQCLCGLPWGVFQTLATSYASEVMPVALRGYILSTVNLFWLLGQITALGVIRGLVSQKSAWSYRIPFGLQWAFVLPILAGVFFAPESPWWLIRHERPEDARKALSRLTTKRNGSFNTDDTIAMMAHTNEIEKSLGYAGTSYVNCFKGINLRRTEITCIVWVAQQVCSSSLPYYATYFYEQAGLDVKNAFNLAIWMYAIGIAGSIISWFLLSRVGRRNLYLWGLLALAIVLIAGGIVGAMPESSGQSWALGSLIIVFELIYYLTVGPVCYILVAEIPSTRLRVKTMVLARVAYNIAALVTNTITPRMLNPTAWNWKGKSCFLYAGTTIVCLIWCYWRLPEPFGLGYLEIDILFEKQAKASKFRKLRVQLEDSAYFSLSQNGRQGNEWH